MRMMSVLALGLLACGGKDGDTGPEEENCDVDAELVSSIPANEWPEGLSDALIAFDDLGGFYVTTECDSANPLTFRLFEPGDTRILTGQLPATSECGITWDPDFDPDWSYRPVGDASINLSITGHTDPGFTGEVIGLDATLYGVNAPFRVRMGTVFRISPAAGSEWIDAEIVLRRGEGTALSGHLALVNDSETLDCPLTLTLSSR